MKWQVEITVAPLDIVGQVTRRPKVLFRLAFALIAGGVLLVVAYALLNAFGVGGIGQPSDIGGGMILLLGLLSAVAGGAVLLAAFSVRHIERR